MLTNIHPATSVKDAIEQLDSHIPLVHAERKLVVQSLWDAAFRDGAKQGRQAGVEAVQNHLRSVAKDTPDPYTHDLLLALAATFDTEPGEYHDPGTVLRENLAAKARQRDGG